ncbi:hypothetical protein Vau01_109860 [Virgisporangium aurantiacum]|uniref:Uncharacterized protein n=1 Tax=Virgisporangium aurantiacum TaxID=175570 RepID=A0A8J3ZL79_9ACTN|nr:hypothetical protein Vau01_109860 [Virgisporangium aurantiacum]
MALLTNPANAVAAPPKACIVAPLPEAPNWSYSNVDSADPTGRFVAGGGYPADAVDFNRFSGLWDNGQLREVAIPGTHQMINDVNSSGTAVGQSNVPDTFELMTPWVIVDGRTTALPGMASGTATGINERGDIVGHGHGDAVIWKAGSTWPQKLERPPGAEHAGAADIDDDGTVLGWFDRAGKPGVVVWRPDGRIVELASPLGPSSFVGASRLRDGWVAGTAVEALTGTAVRWNLADGTATTYPHLGFAADVNGSGWIVGQQADRPYLAVYVTDNGEMLLPGLVTPATVTEVKGMSDDGRRLAGHATGKDGNVHAVRWTCE